MGGDSRYTKLQRASSGGTASAEAKGNGEVSDPASGSRRASGDEERLLEGDWV
jgi:hypothetical protein